jgi:hypothetical protein
MRMPLLSRLPPAAAVVLLAALACTNRTPLDPLGDPPNADGGGPSVMHADAAPADADAGTDATVRDGLGSGSDSVPPCTVTTAAGATLPCTEKVVAFSLADAYCGLKAGQVRCWSDQQYFADLLAPVAAKAPPGLVQIAAAETVPDDPALCGLDAQGNGTCWGAKTMTSLGGQLSSAVLSRYGTCALHRDGHVDCAGGFPSLPPGHRYVQIAVAADFLIGLDDGGAPINTPPYPQTPPGVYRRVAVLGGAGAAVRADGTLIYMGSPAPVLFPGSFVDLTFQFPDRLCGVDGIGDVACFSLGTGAHAPLVPPPGPFVQIAAGSSSMCGLRPTGTTMCWGDVQVPVPDGW